MKGLELRGRTSESEQMNSDEHRTNVEWSSMVLLLLSEEA